MTVTLVGGVPFDAAGEAYVLRFSVSALMTLEDKFDKSTQEVLAMMEGGRVKTMRTIFWAGLRDFTPDITEDQAGEVMTAIGIEEASALLTRAMVKAFPSAGRAVEGEGAASPQKPGRKAGNGATSSAHGAGSV
jgi:hypothetical protein